MPNTMSSCTLIAFIKRAIFAANDDSNDSETNDADLSCLSFASGVWMPQICGAFNPFTAKGFPIDQ